VTLLHSGAEPAEKSAMGGDFAHYYYYCIGHYNNSKPLSATRKQNVGVNSANTSISDFAARAMVLMRGRDEGYGEEENKEGSESSAEPKAKANGSFLTFIIRRHCSGRCSGHICRRRRKH